jgi:hypothetical protein
MPYNAHSLRIKSVWQIRETIRLVTQTSSITRFEIQKTYGPFDAYARGRLLLWRAAGEGSRSTSIHGSYGDLGAVKD